MKIFAFIVLIFMVLGTVCVTIKQPQMHTRVLIYDSQYTIVDDKQKSKPVEVEVKETQMPTMPVENKLTKEQVVFESEAKSNIVKNVKNIENLKTDSKIVQNQVQTQTIPKITVKTSPATVQTSKNPAVNVQTIKTPNTSVQRNPDIQISTNKVSTPQTVKILTAQEEEIAWNIWRSNLQNQIMKDSRLPVVPFGTVFKVSFDVDKNGRVTNVQTWSTDSRYTPYAIEFIAPVIRSYQGKSILDFPQGSQRVKTTFTGGWKISQTAKYSNPNDYNDIERVIK